MKLTKQAEGTQNSQTFSKKTGFFLGEVIALNPDASEIAEILGVEEDKVKEKEYISETTDGETCVNLSFWIKDKNSDFKTVYQVRLIDKDRVGQTSGKQQYVNCVAGSSWVNDEKDLPTWFTKFTNKDKNEIGDKEYREAKVGEADLYEFMRNWLCNVNFFSVDTNCLVDWKKLMRGNVKELQSLIGSEEVGPVVFLAEVNEKDVEGEIKEYQSVYKSTLGGYKWASLGNSIQTGNFNTDKGIKKFIEDLQGEYGSKNKYSLSLLKDYDKNNVVSNGAPLSENGSDY